MEHTEEIYQVLLSSKTTILVVIDHQVAFQECYESNSLVDAESGLAELIDAASQASIPVITSLVETNLISSRLSDKLESRLPCESRHIRSGLNPWDSSTFAESLQETNRPCLLIAGISVETSLSFTALGALARGFDVFVIKDACLGYSERSISITFDRLIQAGVVPVTWRQVMMEWSQDNVDARQLRRIFGPKKSS